MSKELYVVTVAQWDETRGGLGRAGIALYTLDRDKAETLAREYVPKWPKREHWEPSVEIEIEELDKEIHILY